MKTKQGISLIVLVITIIVLAILASAVIVTLSNANIIGQATETVVRADFKGFQEELEVYVADKMLTSWQDDRVIYDRSTLYVAASEAAIYDILPSLENSKYAGFVYIIAGELAVEDGAPNEDIIKDLLASGALSDIPSPSYVIEGDSLVLKTESQDVKGYDIYMDGELVDSVTATGSETRYDLTDLALTTEQISVVAKATYGSSAAANIKVGVQLNVKSLANGSITVNGETTNNYTGYVINNGSKVSITAVADDGYQFAYWKRVTDDDTEGYVSTENSIDVQPLGSLVHYEPVFVAEGSTEKIYLNHANQILGTGDVAPETPVRAGYVVGDWANIKETTAVIIYRPSYTKEAGTDTITINYFNGTQNSKIYAYNEEFILNATGSNTKWQVQIGESEPTTISYNSTYSFNTALVGDVIINEVLAQENAQSIVQDIQAVYLTGESKIRFVSAVAVSDGATFIEAGMLLSNDATIAADMKIDTEGIIVGKSRATTPGTIIINKSNVTAGDTWYGRPYLTYTIDGVTQTIYADVMTQKAE